MKRCYGINAKLMDVIRKVMVRNVLAEEPAPAPQPQPVSYEQLIARARQEEKDKLYPQLKAEKDKVAELTSKNNDLLVQVGTLKNENDVMKAQIEDLKNNKGANENAEITRLKEELNKVQKEYKEFKAGVVDEATLRQQVEAEVKQQYEVEMYKVEKLNSDEFKGQIIPELVSGDTKEAIDESLAKSKARYEELIGVNKNQQQQQAQQGQQLGAVPTMPVGNPNTQSFISATISAEEIQRMTPAQWAEYRTKLGLK